MLLAAAMSGFSAQCTCLPESTQHMRSMSEAQPIWRETLTSLCTLVNNMQNGTSAALQQSCTELWQNLCLAFQCIRSHHVIYLGELRGTMTPMPLFAQSIQFNSNCFIVRLNIYINMFVLPAGSPPLDDIV